MQVNKIDHTDTCVKVFNPDEPDITKKLIATYENFSKAGNALEILPLEVLKRCQRKTRIFSPRLKMEVALRIAAADK